jgi:hypothetical protein
MAEWRPGPTGNRVQDEANRQIFDHLYQLKGAQSPPVVNGASNNSTGMTVTASFVGGFLVGKNTYYNMTFQNGRLVGIS